MRKLRTRGADPSKSPDTHLPWPALAGMDKQRFTLVVLGRDAELRGAHWSRLFPHAQVEILESAPPSEAWQANRPLLIAATSIADFWSAWPWLRPRGFFVLEEAPATGSHADDVPLDVLWSDSSAPPSFEAYGRSTIASVERSANSWVVRKKGHRQPVFRLASLASVAEKSWTTDLGSGYPRMPAVVRDAPSDVAEDFRALVDGGPVAIEPAISGEIRNATVHGQGPTSTTGHRLLAETMNAAWGVTRTSNLYWFAENNWVGESKMCITHHPIRCDGRRYVLLKQTWDHNYGHWLVDTLPKIGLLGDRAPLSEYQLVVNEQPSHAMRGVVLDSLALTGVRADQVDFTDQKVNEFERLTVLGTISRHPVTKSPFAIRFLERLAADIEPGPDRRIYVSRNDTPTRRLLNEALVRAAGRVWLRHRRAGEARLSRSGRGIQGRDARHRKHGCRADEPRLQP